MRSARFLALVLGLLVSSHLVPGGSQALAGDKDPIDAALAACLDHNATTVGMRQCQAKAQEDWDAALNTAYQALMAAQTPEAKTALRTAQRQWLAFRDAETAYLKSVFATMDGTIWPVIELQYVTDLSRKRTIALRCAAKMTDLSGVPDPQCQ